MTLKAESSLSYVNKISTRNDYSKMSSYNYNQPYADKKESHVSVSRFDISTCNPSITFMLMYLSNAEQGTMEKITGEFTSHDKVGNSCV